MDRYEFTDDPYTAESLLPESMARLAQYLGITYSNFSKLKIDMPRRIIWLDGYDLLHLTPETRTMEPVPDGCPKCGHRGTFIKMALCCPKHGVFGGI